MRGGAYSEVSGLPREGVAAGQATATAGANTRGHVEWSGGKEDFIRSLWPHARQVASELGVDPHALLAQAALETGWGRSVPCTAGGECSFNLFGIKAGGQWRGAQVAVPTLEYEGGVAVRKVERFRAYASAAESFRDYAKLIRDNPRYQDALNVGGDVAAFANALQRGGYATDPDYARKIVAVAGDVRDSVSVLKADSNAPISVYGEVRT
jgi:flagellar protein FlgJ